LVELGTGTRPFIHAVHGIPAVVSVRGGDRD
jgi:hypothetical protein